VSPERCNHIWKILQHTDMSWIKSQLETILCIWLADWTMKTYRTGHNKTLNIQNFQMNFRNTQLPTTSILILWKWKVLLVENAHCLHICNLVDLYIKLCALQHKFWNKAGVFTKLITLEKISWILHMFSTSQLKFILPVFTL
jgi:hypothetical protein